jgi:hypothetical protein
MCAPNARRTTGYADGRARATTDGGMASCAERMNRRCPFCRPLIETARARILLAHRVLRREAVTG